jgi:hypothetical protein
MMGSLDRARLSTVDAAANAVEIPTARPRDLYTELHESPLRPRA